MMDAADASALELGLLLSYQQETFGINMLDAMLPSDQFEIDSLRFAGYSEIEAKQMIFENRYYKTDDREVQREKYATISEYQLALRNSTLNAHLTPKKINDNDSMGSRTSSKSSMTRKVSFSEELEQVKVFLIFDDLETVEETDETLEDLVVAIVPSTRNEELRLPDALDERIVEKELEPSSPKSITRSWSLFQMFKSTSSNPGDKKWSV